MFRRVRIRPRQHEAPVGIMAVARPDLLAVDHPLIAILNRPRL